MASSAIRRSGARRCARSPGPPPDAGLAVLGFASSGLPGPKGNRETFLYAAPGREPVADLEAAIAEVEQ